MRYEKKLLILSGEGKGIVLIEKSGLGVSFALRTFGVRGRAGLFAGVVTRTRTVVRELPASSDPSCTFTVDDCETDELHFAVFDSALVLYGATGKRMWEANLLDLLLRRATPVCAPDGPTLPELPPLSVPPQSLPLPDGSGLQQTRLALYGDDALAADNFYSTLDLSSRLSEVDGFLDGTRVLDGLSPRIVPPGAEPDGAAGGGPAVAAEDVEQVYVCGENEMTEVAAAGMDEKTEGEGRSFMPWELTARWLSARYRSGGEAAPLCAPPVTQKCEVKRLREVSFLERARGDMEKLFRVAPPDGELKELVPDADWVKVELDGGTVSVGRLGERYLCYAVPGEYESISPFGRESKWLPKAPASPAGGGYWLIFQNIVTGDIVDGE